MTDGSARISGYVTSAWLSVCWGDRGVLGGPTQNRVSRNGYEEGQVGGTRTRGKPSQHSGLWDQPPRTPLSSFSPLPLFSEKCASSLKKRQGLE